MVLTAGFVAALLVLLGAPTATAADIDPLGPTPQVCNVFAPTPVCFYAAVSGTDTFNISKHILFPGDKVTGTFRWSIGGQGGGEYASVGTVKVAAAGPGLGRAKCRGKMSDSNAKAKWRSDHAFDVTTGSTTCTWKAKSPTDAWVNGPTLQVYASGGIYPAGDFYAVLSKGGAIEGHVREQNLTKEIAAYAGLEGAKVRIAGPRGYRKTVTTSDTGYFHVVVARAGSYTVTPSPPKGYFKGSKPRKSTPESKRVHVREGHTAKADFTYRSTLKLKITLDRTTALADGGSVVTATITSVDGGDPAPSQPFSLRPFGGGSFVESAYSLKVPATLCNASGSRVWPDPKPTTPNTNAVDATTDATGQLTLKIHLGTVPGTFPLSVWAQDTTGNLIKRNLSDVSDDADITVTAPGGGADAATAVHDWVNRVGNESLAGSLPTGPDALTSAMIQAMSPTRGSGLASFVVTPVKTAKPYYGVLLTPEGSRVTIDPATGVIDPASPGWVITPTEALGTTLAAGGFWGLVKTTSPPKSFPTLQQWLANGGVGYAFPGNAPPITRYNASGLQYGGFGYGPGCT